MTSALLAFEVCSRHHRGHRLDIIGRYPWLYIGQVRGDDGGMDRAVWDLRPDAVQRALDAFLPRSGGQVIREAFYGVTRFDDFVAYTGLTPAAVSARLKALVEQDMLRRTRYQEPGERARDEYQLTDKSRDLLPAVVALLRWSDRWLPSAQGPTLTLRHSDCGHEVHAELRCTARHHLEHTGELVAEPGPGARRLDA